MPSDSWKFYWFYGLNFLYSHLLKIIFHFVLFFIPIHSFRFFLPFLKFIILLIRIFEGFFFLLSSYYLKFVPSVFVTLSACYSSFYFLWSAKGQCVFCVLLQRDQQPYYLWMITISMKEVQETFQLLIVSFIQLWKRSPTWR